MSFLASIRRLFRDSDEEEARAKRPRQTQQLQQPISQVSKQPASTRHTKTLVYVRASITVAHVQVVPLSLGAPLFSSVVVLQSSAAVSSSSSSAAAASLESRSVLPLPSDFADRVTALIDVGWPMRFAVTALERHAYNVSSADAWLQAHHPTSRHVAAPPPAAAASSSSSSRGVIDLSDDDTPCLFERIPSLLPVEVELTPSTSLHSLASDSASLRSHTPPSDRQLSPDEHVWSCSVCTFENSSLLPACEMCETARSSRNQHDAPDDDFFECGICFTQQSKHAIFAPQSAESCGHRFCIDCSRQYLSSKVESGLVLHLRCAGDRCTRQLSTEEVREGLDARGLARYLRYRRLQELAADPNVIFCPSASCEVALFSSGRPRLTCPDCSKSVCFACKVPWHTDQTCQQYAKTAALRSEHEKLSALSSSEQLFARFLTEAGGSFRQCRNCTAWVEKTDGCSKMTCRCGGRWCFDCGTPEATCKCTPSNHVFYSHATVVNNWGRSGGSRHTIAQSMEERFGISFPPSPFRIIRHRAQI